MAIPQSRLRKIVKGDSGKAFVVVVGFMQHFPVLHRSLSASMRSTFQATALCYCYRQISRAACGCANRRRLAHPCGSALRPAKAAQTGASARLIPSDLSCRLVGKPSPNHHHCFSSLVDLGRHALTSSATPQVGHLTRIGLSTRLLGCSRSIRCQPGLV